MLNSSVLMKAAGRRRLLPSGYVGVDYLIGQEGTYINTEINSYPGGKYVFEIDYPLDGITKRIGVNAGYSEKFFENGYSYLNGTRLQTRLPSESMTLYEVYYSRDGSEKSYLKADDQLLVEALGTAYETRGYVCLGANTYSNSPDVVGLVQGYWKNKIRSFSSVILGIKTRDMKACIRTSDLKPGMYDTVSKQFFVNEGTGEFLFGPLSLPSGLTQSGDPYMYQGHGCVDVIINWSGRNAIYDLVTRTITYYNE